MRLFKLLQILSLGVSLQGFADPCAVELATHTQVSGGARIATSLTPSGVATVAAFKDHVLFFEDRSERMGSRLFPDFKATLLRDPRLGLLHSLSVVHAGESPLSGSGYYAGISQQGEVVLSQTHAVQLIELPPLPSTAISLTLQNLDRGFEIVVATRDELLALTVQDGVPHSTWQVRSATLPFVPDFLTGLDSEETDTGTLVLTTETGEISTFKNGNFGSTRKPFPWVRALSKIGDSLVVIAGDGRVQRCDESGTCTAIPMNLPEGVYPLALAASGFSRSQTTVDDRWAGGYLSRPVTDGYERVLVLGSDGKLYSPWGLGQTSASATTAHTSGVGTSADRGLADQALMNMLTSGLPETDLEVRLSLEAVAHLNLPMDQQTRLFSTYAQHLRHRRILSIAPEIASRTGLGMEENLLLLDLLAEDTRYDLLRLEFVSPGERSAAEVDRIIGLLQSDLRTAVEGLNNPIFNHWDVLVEKLSGCLGMTPDTFKTELLEHFRKNQNTQQSSFGSSVITFFQQRNPFGR